MKIPQYIIIHHSAVSWQKNPNQWPATDAYHKSKGWGGGGYNYEVAANGDVHQFRPDGTVTAAQYQENMNDGRAISICLDGNFDIEDPTPEQIATVKKMIMDKMTAYKIPKENIWPHRKVAINPETGKPYKTCCGSKIPDDLYSYFVGVQNVIPDWAKSSIDKATKKGAIKDWSNPLEAIGGEKLEYIFENLGIFDKSKHEGKVTLSRFAVGLDKMGVLD